MHVGAIYQPTINGGAFRTYPINLVDNRKINNLKTKKLRERGQRTLAVLSTRRSDAKVSSEIFGSQLNRV